MRLLQRLRAGAVKAWTLTARRLRAPVFGATRKAITYARRLPAVHPDPSTFYPLDDDRAARYVDAQGRTPKSTDTPPFNSSLIYPLCSLLVPQGETLVIYEIGTMIGLLISDPLYNAASKPPNPYFYSDATGNPEPFWALRVTPIDSPDPIPQLANYAVSHVLGDAPAEGLNVWNDSRFAMFAGLGKFPIRIPIRERQRLTLWATSGGPSERQFDYLAGRLAGLRFSHRDNPSALHNLRSIF